MKCSFPQVTLNIFKDYRMIYFKIHTKGRSLFFFKRVIVGEESRWRKNRTGRSLSLLQIHQKNNRTVKKVYKTTYDHQQRTSGAQKSSPLSSKGGRTKILKIKKETQENEGQRPVPGRESQQRKFPITRKPSPWRV